VVPVAFVGAAAVTAGRRRRKARAWTLRVASAARAARDADEAPVGRSEVLRGLAGCAGGAVATLQGQPAQAVPPQGYAGSFKGLPGGGGRGSQREALKWEQAQTKFLEYKVPTLQTKEPPKDWGMVVQGIGLDDSYEGKYDLGKDPLLVTFYSPPGWAIQAQSRTPNGPSGTISVNLYAKGDSGTLWVDTKWKGQKKIAELTSAEAKDQMAKALAIKGSLSEVSTMKLGKYEADTDSKTGEFSYILATDSGLDVERRGFANFNQVGDSGNMQVFWCASTTARWLNQKETLKTLAGSFRVGKISQAFRNKDDDDDD